MHIYQNYKIKNFQFNLPSFLRFLIFSHRCLPSVWQSLLLRHPVDRGMLLIVFVCLSANFLSSGPLKLKHRIKLAIFQLVLRDQCSYMEFGYLSVWWPVNLIKPWEFLCVDRLLSLLCILRLLISRRGGQFSWRWLDQTEDYRIMNKLKTLLYFIRVDIHI